LEQLEDRLLMSTFQAFNGVLPITNIGAIAPSNSSAYTLNNGVLTINGDHDNSFAVYGTTDGSLAVDQDGQVTTFGPAVTINSLVLNTGAGHNSVFLVATPHTAFSNNTPRDIYVNSGGDDYVQVGQGNLSALPPVHLSNPSHYTNVVIDDSANVQPEQEAIINSAFVGFDAGTVYFDNCQLSGLSIYGGSGGTGTYGYEITGTPNIYDPTTGNRGFMYLDTGAGNSSVYVSKTVGDLQINGNAGHDKVMIGIPDAAVPFGQGYGYLDPILGSIRVSNTTGTTDLYVDDGTYNRDVAAPRNVTMDDGSLVGMAPAPIYWTAYSGSTGGVISLNIYGNLFGNTFTIQNTSDLYRGTTLYPGDGFLAPNTVSILGTKGYLNLATSSNYHDTKVNVGFAPPPQPILTTGNSGPIGSMANIQGAIYLTNPTGRTILTLADGTDSTPQTAVVTAAAIYGLSPAPIYTYGYIKSLTIYGGYVGDTFDLSAASAALPIAIYGSFGFDTLIGPNAGGTWLINGPDSGQINSLIAFSGIDGLVGGSGDDTFEFLAGGQITGFVNGGLGVNTLDYSNDGGQAVKVNLATWSATLINGGLANGFANIGAVIGSSAATNRLVGPSALNVWQITGRNTGRVTGVIATHITGLKVVANVAFTGFQYLVGGTNFNVFKFTANASISGNVNGGSPLGNWLDYSSVTTPVSVNLATGAATAVGGIVRNIQNVVGGSGSNTLVGNSLGNVLVGGAGINTIVGGTGRSVLIGGLGASTIIGGSASDILIGGRTVFDRNYLALASILKEWQRTDKTYAARIADLRYGGGYNGTNKLSWGSTVLDTGAADNLNGLAGLDWFFANQISTIRGTGQVN
jgi:hypothetical protein